MRRPGIGPGSHPWQGQILPLNYLRLIFIFPLICESLKIFMMAKKSKFNNP